jgi:hypothetical protein
MKLDHVLDTTMCTKHLLIVTGKFVLHHSNMADDRWLLTWCAAVSLRCCLSSCHAAAVLAVQQEHIQSALALQQVLAVCMEVELPWHSHHLVGTVVPSPKLHMTRQRLPICVHTSGKMFRGSSRVASTTDRKTGPIAAPRHLMNQFCCPHITAMRVLLQLPLMLCLHLQLQKEGIY